ncbi:MAG: helix-turn-helix transcriptional regulator [Clostridia bacterium]|nr:helix-turn-helix transcriptional regulator [Clostridia bacterium]
MDIEREKLGGLFQLAVMELNMDIDEFAQKFLSSKMARAFEIANPIYVLGKSEEELFSIIMQQKPQVRKLKYSYSPAYWVGWVLAYAQWYLNRTFEQITDKFPCSKLIQYYFPYHEMDISKSVELIKQKIGYQCPLKEYRAKKNYTQEELALMSEVPVRDIRAYEQGKVEISNAQGRTLYNLAKALDCSIEDLIK